MGNLNTRKEVWSPPAGSVLTKLTGVVTPDDPKHSDEERREKALREKYA